MADILAGLEREADPLVPVIERAIVDMGRQPRLLTDHLKALFIRDAIVNAGFECFQPEEFGR